MSHLYCLPVNDAVKEFCENCNDPYCDARYRNTGRENVKCLDAKKSCSTKSDSYTNNYNVKQRGDACELNEQTSKLLCFLFELSTVAELCLYIFQNDLRYKLMQKSKDLLDNIFSQSDSYYDCLLAMQLYNSLIKVLKTYDTFVKIGKKMGSGQTEKGLFILARQRRVSNREITSVKLTSNLDLPREIRILKNLSDESPNKFVPLSNVYSCTPVYQGMDNPNQRLQTYSRWPTKAKQWPLQLSNAGFYFTGVGTVVKCATCGVETEVESWSLEKPEVVHYKLNDECKFLQANFPVLNRQKMNETVGVVNHKIKKVAFSNNHMANKTVTAKHFPVQKSPNFVQQLPTTIGCNDQSVADTAHSIQSVTAAGTSTRFLVQQSGTASPNSLYHSRPDLKNLVQQSMTSLKTRVEQPETIAGYQDHQSVIDSPMGTQQSTHIHDQQRANQDNTATSLHKTNNQSHKKSGVYSTFNNCTERRPNIWDYERPRSFIMSVSSNYRDRAEIGHNTWTYPVDFPSTSSVNNRDYEPVFRFRHYRHLDQRLLTFRNWTKNHIQPTETLAECGLFYTGEDDIVRCFCCNLGLSEWTSVDNPWLEHARHQPKCWFLRQQKGQGFIDEVQKTWKKKYSPAHPAFDEYHSRLATFVGWREDISQTPEDLAEAGFFFTGVEQNVFCHYCDGGIRILEPNEIPWEQHARWFPSCKFLIKMKGMRFIDAIRAKIENGFNATNTNENQASSTEVTLLESEPVKIALLMGFSLNVVKAAVGKYIQTEGNREFTTDDLVSTIIEIHNREFTTQTRDINSEAKHPCVLCKENERSMLFTNCGHRVTCERCCDSIEFCPTCDKRIKKRIKSFLS